MDNHINIPMIISFFFFLLLIITTFFPQLSHSLPQQLPQTLNSYSICKQQSYNCGNITNIFYPFWGQDSSTYCGAGSPFYLNCHENLTTTILLFSQNFTVLDINTKKHTIKLKRTDLSQNLCSPQFDDIVLSSSPLFHYLPHVKTINIYFNCPSNFSQFLHIESICGSQNQVFDSVAYDERLFRDCENYIQVPVGEDFSMEKNHLNRDELVSGLDKGFEVNYTVSEECLQCLGNQEGDCRLKNIDDFESSCYYCPDGSHASSTHCSYHHSSKLNLRRKILIGVASAVLGAFAVIVAIYFYRRRKNKTYAKSYLQSRSLSSELTSKDPENGSQYFGRSQNFGVQHFTYSELEEATNYFDPSKELGEGGFGTVYYGKLYDGRSVAVKRLYENNYKRVEQFKNEVEILASLVHPNLVSLYGCTSRHSRELLLVYEYVSNGTVADHLRGKHAKQGKLTWPIRMNIAVETASALKYLHISEIIHRDIKTNNILLDAHFHVKVADFGLSRLFPYDQTHVSTAPQGTPGYVDPEYHQCYQLTDKSDVYSFGVVMIELISSLPAVDITRHRHEINLASMALNRIQNQALHEIVDPTLGFESDAKVKKMIVAMGELAFQCLQSSKDMRPTMDEVLESLKVIQNGGKHKNQPEVMDISSLSDDAVLLNHAPPPLSPDSNVRSNYTTPNTSG
ncbi:LEAF RUST 10 DISEASE-RESISTANCE LOCUS RECEPTOR-LIKE PROTEIN KINASE-like 1.4 isoform X3 [Lathyrus oleraceus]|uniref:LEAF RUST 10 DISEASE-RESISTANCE LOCUS RECEPTOR-LIKE PROTEIN KINASE-like 1.4 isoform X3 n=1 Tax=Pisum sativum TaxID=3888 RepID=UPI0021D0406D|nr:LEAF RUST 10 DISEASE-RESISTANCE LOCUS RECEPTOR-LIKE PROTEIN KINASE-like 1.4 isoform X3 [Pisum sativum]